MAAERISSTRPASSSSSRISKPSSGARHQRRGNDRGMEIDQVGSSRGNNRNDNNRNNRNNRTSNNNNNNKNRRGNDSRSAKPKKSAPLNQTDLDKDLESYMMKNESTAKNTLDMDLDSYMSAAPSKA